MMFRRMLSSIVSFAIAFTPMASSAQEYIYRYKFPVGEAAAPEPEPQNPDLGAGNDIQAWFVSPVGYEFAKKIPVATRDVVEWVRDNGSLPDGIELDAATGDIEGIAELPQATEAT